MFKDTLVLASALALYLLMAGKSSAQQRDPPKVEVGGHFTTREDGFPYCSPCGATVAGVGTRVGYNVTDYFGLEGEVNFFPQQSAFGGTTQAQFGVKVGKRFRKFGLFVKARPGFVSLSEVATVVGETPFVGFGGQQFFSQNFANKRRTLFAADMGGAVEFYPSRKLLVRMDVGDTIIRYRGKETRLPSGFTARDLPDGVVHNFQLTAGVAYRFHDPDGADETDPPAPQGSTPRYEAGVQYTMLVLNRPASIASGGFPVVGLPSSAVTPAVGGRFTLNLDKHVALEGAIDFLTKTPFIGGSTYSTNGVQGQFGIKAGHRFKRVGVFGKARPGFLRFSDVVRQIGTRVETRFFPGETVLIALFGRGPKTYFETDVGGVVEFYPKRHIITRFDLSDTIIRYSGRVGETGTLRVSLFRPADETKHNFQFSTGVGFRF